MAAGGLAVKDGNLRPRAAPVVKPGQPPHLTLGPAVLTHGRARVPFPPSHWPFQSLSATEAGDIIAPLIGPGAPMCHSDWPTGLTPSPVASKATGSYHQERRGKREYLQTSLLYDQFLRHVMASTMHYRKLVY